MDAKVHVLFSALDFPPAPRVRRFDRYTPVRLAESTARRVGRRSLADRIYVWGVTR